jgi:glutamate--cysteine ligase
MVHCQSHEAIIKHLDTLKAWREQKKKNLPFPIYTSVDIRDSGYKVVSVDANIYPAGFNNICGTDLENAPAIFDEYITTHYEKPIKNVLLITEEHTNNAYYWENVHALATFIAESGREVRVTMPKDLSESMTMETAFGNKVIVSKSKRDAGTIIVDDKFIPDIIISNNDFSVSYEDWNKGLETIINPPRGLGWFQRKKSTHFEYYNQLAAEFADIIKVDPWTLQVETRIMSDFNPNLEASKKDLATQVDEMIARISANYQKRNLDVKPTVFIKNNAGTYGLAVTKVESGAEVLAWNNRTRTKMKAAKGGRDVEEIIIQEGVPTTVKSEDSVAEPVIYMLGCQLLGGFLRTHSEKGATDSLNSPGAIFKRLCVTDLKVQPNKCPPENVYGWIATLSCLATGLEAKSMGVEFPGYRP